MSKLRENSFKRQANARRKKKELEMPFRNLQKFYKEPFFEFSERCYFILEKVERFVTAFKGRWPQGSNGNNYSIHLEEIL